MAKAENQMPAGVYAIRKKNGAESFRASLTRKGKHISLGSFSTPEEAHDAYCAGCLILADRSITLEGFGDSQVGSRLPFDKAVSLVNLRENGIYFGTPILLGKRDFLYYLSPDDAYRFDLDDLFYYASHRIMRRGGRLFVADYGSQLGVMARFGIRSFAVAGRDYFFRNGDDHDLRYENIEIVNRYRGVRRYDERGFRRYKTVIHVRGDFLVGRYETEIEAAIAYNKAADVLVKSGIRKHYELNYPEDVEPSEYAEIYRRVVISPRLSALQAASSDRSEDR